MLHEEYTPEVLEWHMILFERTRFRDARLLKVRK